MNNKTTEQIIEKGTREEIILRLQEYMDISKRLEIALHNAIKAIENIQKNENSF